MNIICKIFRHKWDLNSTFYKQPCLRKKCYAERHLMWKRNHGIFEPAYSWRTIDPEETLKNIDIILSKMKPKKNFKEKIKFIFNKVYKPKEECECTKKAMEQYTIVEDKKCSCNK